MAGTALHNLEVFERLCGNHMLTRVILVTTMWDEIEHKIGERREDGLRRVYWQGMIARGAQTKRFLRTPESAFSIISPLLDNVNAQNMELVKGNLDHDYVLLHQREVVDQKLSFRQTSAGQRLYWKPQDLVERRQNLLRKVTLELEMPTDIRNESNITALMAEAEFDDLKDEIEKACKEMEGLKLSLDERISRAIVSALAAVPFGRSRAKKTH